MSVGDPFDPSRMYSPMQPLNNMSKTSVGSTANLDMEDRFGRPRHEISDNVCKLEDRVKMLEDEFYASKDQLKAIRKVLGMPPFEAGQMIKLSTALREIALEIDKRTDGMFLGPVDPVMDMNTETE